MSQARSGELKRDLGLLDGIGIGLRAIIGAGIFVVSGVAAAVVLTLVNYFGIRRTGNVNSVIVLISIAALLYIILAGIPSFSVENLTPFAARLAESV